MEIIKDVTFLFVEKGQMLYFQIGHGQLRFELKKHKQETVRTTNTLRR